MIPSSGNSLFSRLYAWHGNNRLFPTEWVYTTWVCLPLSTPPYQSRMRSRDNSLREVEGLASLRTNTDHSSYCLLPSQTQQGFHCWILSLLTHLRTLSPDAIVLADFNIHVDNMNHIFTAFFASCLDSFGFQQHINFPTHSKGHILDLVCCSGISLFNCSSTDLPISDYTFISFNLNFGHFQN